MNFFCFGGGFVALSEELFETFLDTQINVPKSEFYIPKIADEFIKSGRGKVEVIGTDAKWFGVTYKEDAEGVRASIATLVTSGVYPAPIVSQINDYDPLGFQHFNNQEGKNNFLFQKHCLNARVWFFRYIFFLFFTINRTND